MRRRTGTQHALRIVRRCYRHPTASGVRPIIALELAQLIYSSTFTEACRARISHPVVAFGLTCLSLFPSSLPFPPLPSLLPLSCFQLAFYLSDSLNLHSSLVDASAPSFSHFIILPRHAQPLIPHFAVPALFLDFTVAISLI